MAAAGGDANLPELQAKREAVQRMIDDAAHELETQKLAYKVSLCGKTGENSDDWNHALSEGLGVKFKVDWLPDHFSKRVALRQLRKGEPIFDIMKSQNLNPEWNGTMGGGFTITAVDMVGVKLALCMAMHSRLGSDSPLSLVSSLALTCGLHDERQLTVGAETEYAFSCEQCTPQQPLNY